LPSGSSMAFHKKSDIETVWTSLPTFSSLVPSQLISRRSSHSSSGLYRRMANGKSWYTLMRGGTAFKSVSRSSMRFLSEDIRIFLQSRRRKRQPRHGACRMVFEQVVLVCLEQEALDKLAGQKEQLPVGKFQELRS